MKYTVEGIEGYLAICLNEKERQAIRERRYDEIDGALEGIREKKSVKEGLKKYLRGNQIDYEAVTEAERYDGVSAIFSSRNLTAAEMVKAYFEKDKVEKSFRCLKGLIEMDKVRFWLANRVKGHIFVCYLAYLLMSVLEYKLRKIGIKGPEALETLESLYRVYITDPKTKNQFIKTVALNKKQEDILQEINPLLLQKCGV
jgi:transposase